MSKKTLFLINPVSGGRTGIRLKESLDRLLGELALLDSCETAFTTADGSLNTGQDLADYPTVIVAGGDGTVAQIVQKLAGLNKKPRLGIIPLGTGNDLARISGCYRMYQHKGLQALVPALLAGKTQPLDVFSVNENLYFTNYCGIGLDAKISNHYNLTRHTPLMRAAASFFNGRPAYAWFSAVNLFYHMPFALEFACADAGRQTRTVQIAAGARQVLVTSIPSYAAGARPAHQCNISDGLFEVTVIETLWQWFMLHMTRFAGLCLPPSVTQFQTDSLTMNFPGSTCFQADGELYACFSSEGPGLTIKRATQIDLIFI